ncbi:SNF2 family N-terminal domain-containing protein [Dichotomocladium elegans]|nr:SNF2 family N-terminal domain-containing protein [Dichotomocladium elegans]
MALIEGAIGTESLASYLIEQYTIRKAHDRSDECKSCSNNARLHSSPPAKRVRFSMGQTRDHYSSVIASVTMPVRLNDSYVRMLRDCIPSNFSISSADLTASWTVDQVRLWADTHISASLVIQHAQHVTLIRNESMRPKSPENGKSDLHIALARAASCGVVECPHICINYYHHPPEAQQAHAVELRMTIAINCDQSTYSGYLFDLINVLYPSIHETPEDTSIEAFFRHLQPPVSKKHIAQCQSQDLVPTLAPFQSQNVEWMDEDGLPLLWESIRFDSNPPIYINRVSHQYAFERHPALDEAMALSRRGGILADEMGLGKTVCVIALLLLHKLTVNDPLHPKPGHYDGLLTTGATLIITPPAILQQWESELRLHAPTLRVSIYRGIKQAKGAAVETAENLSKYDVVLTDYKVLQEECHYATVRPNRLRRHSAKYVHQRSPLVELLWFRVILDEAQMVESKSVSMVVQMAIMIPRWYAWGITGTPIKSSFEDIFGLCRFLPLAPYIQKYSQFKALLNPLSAFKGTFWDFSRQIMRRNMKANLADQVHIPVQHRRIVNVTFSPIEQQYYQSLWEQCARATQFQMLDRRQWAPPEESELDDTNDPQVIYTKLRAWLLTLRQACVHPTVGSSNKLRVIHQTINTLDEVLRALIDQSKDELEALGSRIAAMQVRRAGMHELMKHWDAARDVYLNEAVPFICDMLRMCDDRLKDIKNKANDEEKKDHHRQRENHGSEDEGIDTMAKSKGGDDGQYKRTYRKKIQLQMSLHQCYFFLGGIYHVIGDGNQERENYDKAAAVRRDILSRVEEKVNAARRDTMKRLKAMETEMTPSPQKESLYLSFALLDRINTMAQIMNEQLAFLNQCRTALHELLCTSLVDHSDNEATVYEGMWITGLRHDIEQKQKEADTCVDSDASPSSGRDIKRLQIELWNSRKKFAPQSEHDDNMRNITSRLREILADPSVSNLEKHIISSELYRLNAAVSKQREMQEYLETEYRRFTSLYNHRIEYYKYLQQISDEVVSWESNDPRREIDALLTSVRQQQRSFKEISARCRYLENMSKEKSQTDEKSTRCLICLSHIAKGLMTFCGHMYCKECATLWFRSHRRCPQCNTSVSLQECYAIAWDKSAKDIMTNKQTLKSHEQLISPSLLAEINEEQIVGGLGSKLDSIIRHIKYIIRNTGGKSVVFSQWKDVLHLIAGGLKKNKIESIQLDGVVRDDRIRRFRDDPNTHVLLLHARSQSSGLTLVSAQTVFIVEPVINESLEKQAISRVHRIGQTKEAHTIEERIHALHSAQRQRLIQSKDPRLETQNSVPEPPAVLASYSEGGGEQVSDLDLQRCFTSDESWALCLERDNGALDDLHC